MTRDEIVIGMGWPALANHIPDAADDVIRRIESIIRSAEAAEREECAKVCDNEARMHESLDRNGRSRHLDDAAVAETCGAAIRARSMK